MTRRAIATSLFLRAVRLERERIPDASQYPFAIPAVRALDELALDAPVTFFIGENGAGKSTLLEAIAVAAGFNAEGGSRNFKFHTRRTESALHEYVRIVRGVSRPSDAYFLRAESFYNVSTEVERLGVIDSHGGISLHERSHGEAFMQLATERFRAGGLYLLDEPEAALSPQRQLALLDVMHGLAARRAQFLVSTHSPILMAYPGARIYLLDDRGIRRVEYEDTEHYRLTRDFLNNRDRYFHHLFADEPASGTEPDEPTPPTPRRKTKR